MRIARPVAQIRRHQADIVFCIDSTGSMDPCIDGVRSAIGSFADSLQSAAQVDFRLKFISYRDLHDPACIRDPGWVWSEWLTSTDQFKEGLSAIKAAGGGDAPESTLDALYRALASDWRPSRTHKIIILLTDDDTHPTMHRSTYSRPDNDVTRIIQDFQTMDHALLFIIAPKFPIYERLSASMVHANRKVIAHWVPYKDTDERYSGLRAVAFDQLLTLIGKTVSSTIAADNLIAQ